MHILHKYTNKVLFNQLLSNNVNYHLLTFIQYVLDKHIDTAQFNLSIILKKIMIILMISFWLSFSRIIEVSVSL